MAPGPVGPHFADMTGIRIALVLALSAAACGPPAGRAASELRGSVLPVEPGFDFTLTDMHGRPFRFRQEAEGRATLLFFGYTNCPDICPVHMANLAAALERASLETRRRVRVVFVTADPGRDTPERLREWLGGFDRAFLGLTGPVEQVREIQAALGLPPAVRQAEGEDGYSVGHSARVVAFTADGGRRVDYPFGTRQADWAHDLPLLAALPGEGGSGS